MEYSDRYGGQDYPDPDTMCDGQCEGTGTYPEYIGPMNDDGTQPLEGSGDWNADWTFVTCPDCGGTGKAQNDNTN